MSQLRIEKIQELMKQEISQIILQELKDPRIGFVTVTQVEITRDLSSAKVFVSIMGNDEQIAEKIEKAVTAALNITTKRVYISGGTDNEKR